MMTNRKQKLTVTMHLFIATLATMISAPAWANVPVESFLSEKDYADFETMFAPPGSDDPLFFYDLCHHAHARSLWETQRAEEARLDSPWEIGVAERFEKAFDQEISLETTPELYELLQRVTIDVSISLRSIKNAYLRVRPYVYFGEGTLIPDDEDALRGNGSFPSGHSAVGFAFALILAEVAPEHQTEVFKRGIDYGDSRVIANYHWRSDVEAARVIASMVVARLHACDAFREQLERARNEHRSMPGKV